MAADAALASLLARRRASDARWALVAPVLPPELAAASAPGPIDEQAWTILADHAAAAAKLRHLRPQIEAELVRHGLGEPAVRIKLRLRPGS